MQGGRRHLQVPLWLHEAAHDAEHGVQLLTALCVQLGGSSWDDGVEGALAGGQAVGVGGVDDEVGTPVLEQRWQVSSQNTASSLPLLRTQSGTCADSGGGCPICGSRVCIAFHR